MAGQTINDRLLAAKHSIAGQGLAKSVCKATTEELLGPKKKHLDYLVHCTNEPNVSIPQMANLLIERSQNTSWIVVFKALITTHHLMCYGNERFTQYLASSNVSFQLSSFVDKTGVQSAVGARTGYDMSPFIRRYARYLNEKALSYRVIAFDFCKVKRGKEEGTLRSLNSENLLKTLPILQGQLDALLEFDCTPNDLTNGVINMCFMLLFRDLIRLFACYNDGIINLLEKYFEMNRKQCREALDLYKKFLIRMDRVAEFLKVAENIGIDKGDIPDLTRAPNSLLEALESHLISMEGNTPTAVSHQKSLKSGVSALSNTTNAFASVDDSFKQAAVAEEEAALNQYRANVGSPSASQTNPFLSEEPTVVKTDPILDLFAPDTAPSFAAPPTQNQSNALEDLLSLGGNPFADVFTSNPANLNTEKENIFDCGLSQTTHSTASSFMFAHDFKTQSQAPFGGSTQTTYSSSPLQTSILNTSGPSVFDSKDLLDSVAIPSYQVSQQPAAPPQRPTQPAKLLTGDLESSLTSLVENLTMDSGPRSNQWNSPKNQPKVASGGWQPQPMAATNAASYRPMSQPMMGQTMSGQPMMGQCNFGQPMQYTNPTQQQNIMNSPKTGNAQAQFDNFDPFGSL
ncbi:hypothetical protein WA026_009414 [Henosepilachna vigintioctopunctata]|uniref:ENTH domain-containing protein n=1 Tax=Henosepilachna vigintioctopunctata TaxID=420089 RepID=A0AAW1U4V7_9CUCU